MKILCYICETHIYDWVPDEPPSRKHFSPVRASYFKGVNGFPDPSGHIACPACGKPYFAGGWRLLTDDGIFPPVPPKE